MSKRAPRPPRPPITVQVTEHDGPPVDLEAWARRYVEVVLEQEGIRPQVAPTPARSVGSGR